MNKQEHFKSRKVFLIMTISVLRAYYFFLDSDNIDISCQEKMWRKMIITKRNRDYFLTLPDCVVQEGATKRVYHSEPLLIVSLPPEHSLSDFGHAGAAGIDHGHL